MHCYTGWIPLSRTRQAAEFPPAGPACGHSPAKAGGDNDPLAGAERNVDKWNRYCLKKKAPSAGWY